VRPAAASALDRAGGQPGHHEAQQVNLIALARCGTVIPANNSGAEPPA